MEHQNPHVTEQGHQTVMPYLILENARSFIKFAKSVFSMELQLLTRRSEGGIRHAEIRTLGSTIMLADATPGWPPMACSMFVYVEDTDATYRRAIEAGAFSLMEPCDQQYGRGAGFRDPWGNAWWLAEMP